jgi:hypothetical protein
MMLNISRIIRTTCATAPVCRIRLKISPPTKDAKTGAEAGAKTAAETGANPNVVTGASTDAKAEADAGPQADAITDATLGVNVDGSSPPAMDANRGNCEFIIAKSTASIS